MPLPDFYPTTVEELDDPVFRLRAIRKEIAEIFKYGQQNQLRGNLLIRAQLKALFEQEARLEQQIFSSKAMATNLTRLRRNPIGT